MNNTTKETQSVLKRKPREILTPHRLVVAILIKEFFKFRDSDVFKNLPSTIIRPKHIRDFSILILKLTQSPDLNLDELKSILESRKYIIHPVLIQQFDVTLNALNTEGTGYLLDLIDSIGKLIIRDTDIVQKTHTQINKVSVIGYYLRRLLLHFNKLTFSEVTVVLKAFKRYYNPQSNYVELAHPGDDAQRKIELEDWYPERNQWSRRHAELFIASQAALLSYHETKAFNTKELHMHIKDVLLSNPELAEAHFLSYLNFLRVKEFCGAISSLYHSFDRSGIDGKGIEPNTKGFRFAALNLAILHYHFGHKEEAMAALKEAIMLAQEANDNVCLQHALSWLYCLTGVQKKKLLEHSILKSFDLNLTYTMSLGIQSFAEYAGINGVKPKHIFEVITKSDIINCQHTYVDLMCNSYAQKAGLWLFYGKPDMCMMWSQLLLLQSTDTNAVGKTYFGEAICEALCNISNYFLQLGDYSKSIAVLQLAKNNFPNEPISHLWMFCECLFDFVRSFHHDLWNQAASAAQKMGIFNPCESHLRLAELYIRKRDFSAALECVNEVLDGKCSGEANERVDYYIRALILLGEVQCCSNYPITELPSVFSNAFVNANNHHSLYLASIIQLHLANVQLLLNMPSQAIKILDICMVQILAHGGAYDRARVTLLYAKCKVAAAHQDMRETKLASINEAIELLDRSYQSFLQIEAYSRMKDVRFLQARLCHEMRDTDRCNKFAMEYRLLDEEYTTAGYSDLLTFL